VETALARLRPKLLILESSADLYGGDEINRTQVRLFVSYLRQLARDFDCAVILLSHPSVRGIYDDSGTSGNTARHNSVRARMYFKTLSETEGGSHLRALEIKKNNYGPQGETIKLVWKNGVFVPEPKAGSFEREAANKKAEELFLTLLRRFAANGRNVTNKPGTSYAPTVFADEPEGKEAKVSKAALAEAMKQLFASTKIHLDEYGPPSKRRTRLVEVTPVADP
jgi:RecA-family ATPase